MKKFIGVAIILVTLLLAVIYRHLKNCQVKEKPAHAMVPAALKEGLVLSYLLIQ